MQPPTTAPEPRAAEQADGQPDGQAERRVFISYAWTDPAYKRRVKALADRLENDGVAVVIDLYDLQPGHDAHRYMERMVTDPSVQKVLLLCNPTYKEKADGREGGVGTESQILTKELYEQGADPERPAKFVAVVMERDAEGQAPTPAYYGGRIYFDLSDEQAFEEQYDELLHFVFDRPVNERPERGRPPAHILDPSTPSLGTDSQRTRAVRALKYGDAGAVGALADYFDTYVANLGRFQITEEDHPESRTADAWGQLIYDRIAQLKPHRDGAVEVLKAVATYRPDESAWEAVKRFLEGVSTYGRAEPRNSRVFEQEADPFRFLWEELFLYAVAVLLGRERYEAVGYLTQERYLAERGGRREVLPFSALQPGAKGVEWYYQSKGKRWYSPRGELLRERADLQAPDFEAILEADLVLFLNSTLQGNVRRPWVPPTSPYLENRRGPLPLFLRISSSRYLARVLPALGADSEAAVQELAARMHSRDLRAPGYDGFGVELGYVANAEGIGSLP